MPLVLLVLLITLSHEHALHFGCSVSRQASKYSRCKRAKEVVAMAASYIAQRPYGG